MVAAASAAASTATAEAVESLRTELLAAVGELGMPTAAVLPPSGTFAVARQGWEKLGTVNLAESTSQDRKCSIGATIGPSTTDRSQLVRRDA